MVIDNTIKAALGLLLEECDFNKSEMARKLEVTRAYAGKLLDGKSKYFEPKTWARIEPILKPYIKQVEQAVGLDCPLQGECPLVDKDMLRIVEFLSKPENEAEKYKLLEKVMGSLYKEKSQDTRA